MHASCSRKSPRDNVWNHLYRKIMKITSQATHYNSVHKFIPMPQAMRILDAKAAVDEEWTKLETIPAKQLDTVKGKKEVILEAQKGQQESPLCYVDGPLPPQKCGVGSKITEVQRQSRAPRWNWTGLVCVPNDCRKSNGLQDYLTVFLNEICTNSHLLPSCGRTILGGFAGLLDGK